MYVKCSSGSAIRSRVTVSNIVRSDIKEGNGFKVFMETRVFKGTYPTTHSMSIGLSNGLGISS